jgi:ribosome maturation factor RimP
MDLETPLRTLLSTLNIELYDVEFAKGTLNVVVTAPGGIDLDALTKANRTIGEWLDLNDPIPGHYTLDVSSPGLERKLRTAAHFRSAIGSVVTLRELRTGQPTRRLEGTVTAVTDSTVTIEDRELGVLEISLDQVERARTVFVWGGEAKPSPSRGKPGTPKKTSTTAKKKG